MLSLAMIAGMTMWVFASSHDGLPPWANYGILGLVIVGIITRQLVPGWSLSDLKAESQELRKENRELVQLLLSTQQTTLPALQDAAKAVEEAMNELRLIRQQHGYGRQP